MANLILKPSTGGVLKIQNDAGTVDALTVSTGGGLTAAGALAVTGAVTASSTLGVTGNTTLAGTANALGTVTTGNISNTAIVYPAGHIIKTYQKVFSGVQSLSTADVETLVGTGASGSDGDPLELTTDTPFSSSSKYLITPAIHQSRSQTGGVVFRLKYASGANVIVQSQAAGGTQTNATFGRSHPSTLGNIGQYGMAFAGITYLWSPGSGSAQTIGVYMINYGASLNTINRPQSNDQQSHIGLVISTLTVQEVAG